MLDAHFIQAAPSIEMVKNNIMQSQDGKSVQPPNRWEDIWFDMLGAHGLIQGIVECTAPTLAFKQVGLPHPSANHGKDYEHPVNVLAREIIENVRERFDERGGGTRINDSWQAAFAEEIESVDDIFEARETTHAYIWSRVGRQAIRNITHGVVGKKPKYSRHQSWVGPEAVRSSLAELLATKHPRLLRPDIWHVAVIAASKGADNKAAAEVTRLTHPPINSLPRAV